MAKESKCRGCREWKREFEKVQRENRDLKRENEMVNRDRRESMRFAEQVVCDLQLRLQKATGGRL